jgi:hypothetical protein
MHHILKSELLDAMRGPLRDLENLKLVSPSDNVLTQKRELKKKIAELERVQDCDASESLPDRNQKGFPSPCSIWHRLAF